MKVAIHQPNFLPWMGYFYKIAQCDAFVFFDTAEYTKRSYIRRVKIHKPRLTEQDQYLIVPLKKHSDYAKINELRLHDSERWNQKLLAQIYETYHRAKCYYQLEPVLQMISEADANGAMFSELTSKIIQEVSEQLGLSKQWHYAHDMNVQSHKAQANIDMVHQVGGDLYISGQGAKKYQLESEYADQGIQLVYSDFKEKFSTLELPKHMFNKSIIAWMALMEVEVLQEMLIDCN